MVTPNKIEKDDAGALTDELEAALVMCMSYVV